MKVAEKTGWDYDTIAATPDWWLARAELAWSVEAAWQEHEMTKARKTADLQREVDSIPD